MLVPTKDKKGNVENKFQVQLQEDVSSSTIHYRGGLKQAVGGLCG